MGLNQKPIENLRYKLNVKQLLEILWKIKDGDKFYFMSYGEDMMNNIIKQRLGKIKK
jgi:hypothetical protein